MRTESFHKFNPFTRSLVAPLLTFLCGLLFAFGMLCRFRFAFIIGWIIIVLCIVLEHFIAKRRSLNWINVAFFRLNAVISTIFLAVVLLEVIFGGGFRLN